MVRDDRTLDEIMADAEAAMEAERQAKRAAAPAPTAEHERRASDALHYHVNEDAFLPSPATLTASRKTELELKHKRGERWTEAERWEWWKIRGGEICIEINRDLKGKNIARALGRILVEVAATNVSQTLNREKLEDRIAALEARLDEREDGKRLVAGKLRVVGGRKP